MLIVIRTTGVYKVTYYATASISFAGQPLQRRRLTNAINGFSVVTSFRFSVYVITSNGISAAPLMRSVFGASSVLVTKGMKTDWQFWRIMHSINSSLFRGLFRITY